MKRGFAFDAALCVSCKACDAACILENGLQEGTRSVYAWNEDAFMPFSVISLSLACNHCTSPACLTGCPAKAYTVNDRGAVIHHSERCMGCSYCTLKCPYDAPKINRTKGYIEKCHFCSERAAKDIDPACVTACPTGALKITQREEYPDRNLEWFPETGIGPSLMITGAENSNRPVVVPADTDVPELQSTGTEDKIKKEWSLLLFSLLVIFSSAAAISSYFAGNNASPISSIFAGSHASPISSLFAGKHAATISSYPARSHILTGLSVLGAIMAMGVSFFHLGVRKKAWRALLNIFSSPLSREIAAVLVFILTAVTDFYKPGLLPAFITPAAALLTLLSVDLIYLSADRSGRMMFHSGQALFSGLFAVTWLTGSVNGFILFTLLAAGSVVLRVGSSVKSRTVSILFYLRAASLPAVLILMYLSRDWATAAAAVLFVTGLMADRALYYDDFRPENIKYKISDHFYDNYEKARD